MTRARKLAGRAGLLLFSLALALACAEGIYRAHLALSDAPNGDDGGWRARYHRLNTTLYRRSADAELIYEPTPGAAVEMEYGRAAFSADGMRDDHEHSRTPDARVRVAIVGDSLVWSEFLPLDDSLPRRTEEALGAGFEVLNFGVTGYDTMQEAAWYEHAVRAFHPRVVVVVHCMNDEEIMSGPFETYATAGEREAKHAQYALAARVAPVRRETIDDVLAERERHAALKIFARALGIWERRQFARHYVDEYLVTGRDEARRERARRALARLGADIRADGATPVLFISPMLESWDDYHWTELHSFVRDAGEHAGFAVHDPLAAWRRDHRPEDFRISGDNLHYGERGNRIFARTIAEAVR